MRVMARTRAVLNMLSARNKPMWWVPCSTPSLCKDESFPKDDHRQRVDAHRAVAEVWQIVVRAVAREVHAELEQKREALELGNIRIA
jgi:hypothetical protein